MSSATLVAEPPFRDDVALVANTTDPTKAARLVADFATSGVQHDLHAPDASGTLALIDVVQAWTASPAWTAPIGGVYSNTRCAQQFSSASAYEGLIWGNPPAAGATDQVTDPGIYFDPAEFNLEINFLGFPSVLGTNEKGKARVDGGTDPVLHFGGSVEIIAESNTEVFLRWRQSSTSWWDAIAGSAPLELQFRRYTSSTLQNTLTLPQASGQLQVTAQSRYSSSTALTSADRFVEVDTSGGSVDIALYPGNGLGMHGGVEVDIKNLGPSNVNVSVNSGGTIDNLGAGVPIVLVGTGSHVAFRADGTANAWYVVASDRFAAADFGVGTGSGATISGLTVAVAVQDAAMGYLNVRSGIQGGSPATYYENSGTQSRQTLISNGTFLWIVPGAAIIAQLTNTGTLGLGGNTTVPDASCNLELQRTDSGLGLNDLTTTQRDAIVSPKESLFVYNVTTKKLNFWDGTAWRVVTST